MTILEVSSTLETIHVVIGVIMLLMTLASMAYAVYQKIKCGNWAGALQEMDSMLTASVKAVDKIKSSTEGSGARILVQDILKDHGESLESAGLKEKMDAKIKDLGLNENS